MNGGGVFNGLFLLPFPCVHGSCPSRSRGANSPWAIIFLFILLSRTQFLTCSLIVFYSVYHPSLITTLSITRTHNRTLHCPKNSLLHWQDPHNNKFGNFFQTFFTIRRPKTSQEYGSFKVAREFLYRLWS